MDPTSHKTANDSTSNKTSYTNQEYADMKGDPSMRHVYSQRPAAGYPAPPIPHNAEPAPTGRRHYQTTGEANDTVSDSAPVNKSPRHHAQPEKPSYSNQDYADMKGDPSMKYVYCQRPAAGYPSPQVPHNREPSPSGRRHYKTVNDTVDTGVSNTGASSSAQGQTK